MEDPLVELNGFLVPAKYAQEARKVLEARAGRTPAVPDVQQALAFVSADERAMMVTAYSRKRQEAQHSVVTNLAKAVKKVQTKLAKRQLMSYDDVVLQKLLERPLITSSPSDLDEQEVWARRKQRHQQRDQVEVTDTHRSKGCANLGEQSIVWTDEEVFMLTESILIYTFNILKSRGNVKEKIEAMDWIWASDVHSYRSVRVGNQLVQEPVLRKFIPFSFGFCCLINGLDPDTLREAIRQPLEPVLRQLGLSSHHTYKVKHASSAHPQACEVLAGH